jgi:predicted transcriptional regulator
MRLIRMPTREITVSGDAALKMAEAINATTLKILYALSSEYLDVTTISKRLGLSEAYISEVIRQLEEVKLVEVFYEPGKRGIRKVCGTSVSKVIILVKEEKIIEIKEEKDPQQGSTTKV